MKCVLCDNDIIGDGHNAKPVKNGKCCNDCNELVVFVRLLEYIRNED